MKNAFILINAIQDMDKIGLKILVLIKMINIYLFMELINFKF
jgi:hypothetical protein